MIFCFYTLITIRAVFCGINESKITFTSFLKVELGYTGFLLQYQLIKFQKYTKLPNLIKSKVLETFLLRPRILWKSKFYGVESNISYKNNEILDALFCHSRITFLLCFLEKKAGDQTSIYFSKLKYSGMHYPRIELKSPNCWTKAYVYWNKTLFTLNSPGFNEQAIAIHPFQYNSY